MKEERKKEEQVAGPKKTIQVELKVEDVQRRGARTPRTLVVTQVQLTKKGVPEGKVGNGDCARKKERKEKKGVHGEQANKLKQGGVQETEA